MNQDFEINSIVNYLRKSRRDLDRERRTGEDTLDEQKKLMDKVLNEFGVPYDQKFEVGSGDKISSRPVFKEVLEDLKKGKYDAIAVKEISRLGRGSMTDMGAIYDIITGGVTGKSIYIITPHRVYDPKNSGDQRQIRFEMFFAREEFEMIRERLTGARYSAAMEGKWMGNVPFGYDRNRETMRLEPNEDESKVVKLVYQLYLNGIEGRDVRDRAIATYLTRNGIKTPNGKSMWLPNQIKRILTNDAYIGVSSFRTTERMVDGSLRNRPEDEHIIVPNAHEPIINEIDFLDAQKKRKVKSAPRARFDFKIYELTGLVSCRKCGRRMSVNRYKRKRQKGDYYATFLRCPHGCSTLNYSVVLDGVLELLNSLSELDDDMLYDLYKSSHDNSNETNQKVTYEELQNFRNKKRKNLEKRLEFIQEKHFEGTYTDDDYLKFRKEIEKEMSELDKLEDSRKKQKLPHEEPDVFKAKENIATFLEAYNKATNPTKRNNILHEVFDDISLLITKKGTKSRKTEIDLDIILKRNLWNG